MTSQIELLARDLSISNLFIFDKINNFNINYWSAREQN